MRRLSFCARLEAYFDCGRGRDLTRLYKDFIVTGHSCPYGHFLFFWKNLGQFFQVMAQLSFVYDDATTRQGAMSAPKKALLLLREKSVEKLCTTIPTCKRAHKKRRTIDVVDTTDEERRRAVGSLIVLERGVK
ncbi:unnamed protein product, partial [Pylaiella littoralis]